MKNVKTIYIPKRTIGGKLKLFIPSFLACILYLLPLYILLNMSIRSIQDLGSKIIPPQVINIGNYIAVFQDGSIWTGFKNSIILTVLTVAIEIVASAIGAYGIARSQNRLTETVRQSSMAVMMIPGIALLVGTYSLMTSLGMVNSLVGLAFLLAAGGIPGCMFMYTNFITSIPVALDEAAIIDGAGLIKTFFYIIMPQLKAVTVTRIIMIATGCWNQYLMPLYLLQDKSKHTVILVIKSAFSTLNGVSNIPRACATFAIGILPIIFLFVFLQRFIIEGQIDSATK